MTDTDTSAEAIADKFDPSSGEYLVRFDRYRALSAERDVYKARAEQAKRALSGVAANSTDKKARFIATEALAQIDAEPDKFGGE